ncbi:ABC transporter ATP-binding protein [Pontibaca salina]|uniref:ABC transporter ATP-binding protein n=1 Tax=Pontibaca salina TaxID=2795731 RepID=A0A934M0Z6_9RHOB|nr:ABC transporter ATP-binding protein [Pontibaca salina]MBI6630253.1 ABC transporter ATP-binding protein [Pontibaca salina]
MKNLTTAITILTRAELRSAVLLLPLIVLSGLFDMIGVALVFPFLKLLSEPELIATNERLSQIYEFGGFQSEDSFVVFLGMAFIGLLLVGSAFKITAVYAANRWLEGRVHSLSQRLLTVYLRQPYEFMLKRHSSELVATMLSETGRIVSQVYRAISEFVMSFIVLLFMLALLFIVDARMTLLAIGVFAGVYTVMLIVVRRTTTRLGDTILKSNRMRHRIAWEALAGGKQVRLLNRESSLVNSYSVPSHEFASATALSNTVRQAPRHIVEAVTIGGTVILTLALMMQSGGLGTHAMAAIVPMLGVFALGVLRMMPAFQRGYNAIVSLRLSSVSAEAIQRDLAGSQTLPTLPQGAVEPLRFHQSLELRNVSFRYPGTTVRSLKNLNLRIDSGMSVGVVGRTGAGKTTLMDLVLGLLHPTKGEILIDGKVLDPKEQRAWRANVGYVQQDIFLSDASIAQNIAFGVPDDEIDRDRLVSAARVAQIERFILDELPDGFETLVGERGVRLSGGQRQRISIARALYTEPEVIVFDEATSALDTNTEALVMEEIAKLAGQRTLLMVAHRHSTVKDCDLIVTLDAGEITRLGSYADLVATEALPHLVASNER